MSPQNGGQKLGETLGEFRSDIRNIKKSLDEYKTEHRKDMTKIMTAIDELKSTDFDLKLMMGKIAAVIAIGLGGAWEGTKFLIHWPK